MRIKIGLLVVSSKMLRHPKPNRRWVAAFAAPHMPHNYISRLQQQKPLNEFVANSEVVSLVGLKAQPI